MLKKIFKILLIIIAMSINNYVNANTDDSVLVKNRYENIYAVYDGPDRLHLYYAQRYTLNGVTAYCIEPGLGIDTNTYSSTEDWQITNLNQNVRNDIRLIAYYGYDYPNHNTMNYYLATQELIWKKIQNRNVYWVQGEDINGHRLNLESEKETILSLVANHTKKPSFDNQTIEVKLNEEKIINDDNNVLKDYEIYSSNITNVEITNNQLKIMITNSIKNPQIKLIKKHYTNSAALIYYSGNNQKLMRSGILDPVVAVADVKIKIESKVKVTKIDEIYKTPIKKSNIKFKIKNIDSGEYICQNDDCIFITNDSGYFITDLLTNGNYQIEEIEDQDFGDYLWNSEPLTFSINEDSQIKYENGDPTISINFPNKQVKGRIKVYKVGEKVYVKDGEIISYEIPLNGVEYELYANQDIYYSHGAIRYQKNQKIMNFQIVMNGISEVGPIPLGEYCIKEIRTANNYVINSEPYCFYLEYQDKYTSEVIEEIHFKNHLIKGTLNIIKKSPNNKPLSDAKIKVYTKNDELIYEGITNKEGKIILSNLPIGAYYYKETEAPIGYLIDEEKHYFEIRENNEIINEEFINQPKTGIFEFLKTDYNTNMPLSNTLIEIYNSEDELVYSKSTDESGQIIIEDIPYGKYYFIEKKAPEGYTIDNQKYYFEINDHNSHIKANMTNELIKVPNTYLNETDIIYIVSLIGIVTSLFLMTRKMLVIKIVGIILIAISIGVPIYKNQAKESYTKVTEAAVLNYIQKTSQTNETEIIYSKQKPIYNYIAILEIPSIKLKQGLVNKYSKYNDIKYNIQILDGSNMPDIINSNLILAAHSGNSEAAYFKDLSKLNDSEEVYIYYNGTKYIYKINNHYEVLKTGYIDLERDKTENAITLITCKDDNYQIVYLGYLINKELY